VLDFGAAGFEDAELKTAATDPTLGIGVFRARLARGEREQAIDWFLARGASLQPNLQAEAMAEWIATAPAAAAAAGPSKPTAAKTPTRR